MGETRSATLPTKFKWMDTLGCVLTVGKNRFAPRPVGRPKKIISAPGSLSSSSPLGEPDLGEAGEEVSDVISDDEVKKTEESQRRAR